MRCPYCNGINPDQATFCARCGRDLTRTTSSNSPRPFSPSTSSNTQRTVYPPNPPMQRPGQTGQPRQAATPQQSLPRPTVYPPAAPAAPTPARSSRTSTPTRSTATPTVQPLSAAPTAPAAPEPPVDFPPRTMAQLQALATEGLDYTVLADDEGYGKKKIVRIQFRRCAPWQQVATLLKALQQYKGTQFDTVIIQGVYNQERDALTHSYEYTNGQLIFDRNVRLGSQLQNRYQIETDNGYSMEAQRIVLAE